MDIFHRFESVRTYQEGSVPSLHKPVMLLLALSLCYRNHNRMTHFSHLDNEFRKVFLRLNLEGKFDNSHYPFGKLENDGIWEVENSKNLKRTSVGHLLKKELLEKDISGGFSKEIYDALVLDKELIIKIINYLLNKYIPSSLHKEIKEYLKINDQVSYDQYAIREKTVALIGTQKFAISRWWLSKGIEVIQINPDIFSTKNIREAMKYFIAGSAVIKAINGWMLASQIIEKRKYGLTDFGISIYKNDPKLLKSATWWSIHLSLCFSDRGEPYIQFFLKLDSLTKDWITWKQFSERLYSAIEDSAEQSIDSNLEGVKKMFLNDNPLAELGLIEIRKERQGSGISIRLGSPKLTDEILIHALAMCRFAHFKSRESVDFSTLANTGIPNFLCCSKDQLRQHYQRMSQMHEWQGYFSFDHAVDLDSITFKDACDPDKTVLLLLQKGQDTWM